MLFHKLIFFFCKRKFELLLAVNPKLWKNDSLTQKFFILQKLNLMIFSIKKLYAANIINTAFKQVPYRLCVAHTTWCTVWIKYICCITIKEMFLWKEFWKSFFVEPKMSLFQSSMFNCFGEMVFEFRNKFFQVISIFLV